MRGKAIALCRVSTPEQRLSNSLNRQEQSVLKAAQDLEVDVVKTWSGDASSKVGKNVNRKDLKEAYAFCKANKGVHFCIVDEVDRFMRSTAEMFYWIVRFQEIGVKVWFASNPQLNTNDSMAKLLLSLDGFKAEGSNEERQRKSVSGHIAALKDGRYTFPPKPGYMKGSTPGVHIPHPTEFIPLQAAFKEVAGGMYKPSEALKRLNETEFTTSRSPMKIDKFLAFLQDPYYAGILEVNKQVQYRNEHGLHQAMITREEHDQILQLFSKRKARTHIRKHYNPEFPMSKLLMCGDCLSDVIRFTGAIKSNGYAKKTIKYYAKYRARCCKKEYHRADIHNAITQRLSEVDYTGEQRAAFIKALETVWRQKQQDKLQHVRTLYKQREALEGQKSGLVIGLPTAPEDLKGDYQVEITKLKNRISELDSQIAETQDLEQDLVEFVAFALEYTNILKDDWWELDGEERQRCQQLLFPGGIYFDSARKVGTPLISPIYTLRAKKKALYEDRKSLMVELLGIAPRSGR